jgi:hypothetical protein
MMTTTMIKTLTMMKMMTVKKMMIMTLEVDRQRRGRPATYRGKPSTFG